LPTTASHTIAFSVAATRSRDGFPLGDIIGFSSSFSGKISRQFFYPSSNSLPCLILSPCFFPAAVCVFCFVFHSNVFLYTAGVQSVEITPRKSYSCVHYNTFPFHEHRLRFTTSDSSQTIDNYSNGLQNHIITVAPEIFVAILSIGGDTSSNYLMRL